MERKKKQLKKMIPVIVKTEVIDVQKHSSDPARPTKNKEKSKNNQFPTLEHFMQNTFAWKCSKNQ